MESVHVHRFDIKNVNARYTFHKSNRMEVSCYNNDFITSNYFEN